MPLSNIREGWRNVWLSIEALFYLFMLTYSKDVLTGMKKEEDQGRRLLKKRYNELTVISTKIYKDWLLTEKNEEPNLQRQKKRKRQSVFNAMCH